jgi:SAM-dependent methyltransferase
MSARAGLPSDWIVRHLPAASSDASLLDVACGSGRHVRHALSLGYRATGIDISGEGIADLTSRGDFQFIRADLESGTPFPLAGRRFDVVVVTNYLWRPILPRIVECVSTTGLLLYETFAVGQEQFGRPRNPDFLLQPNELLEVAMPSLLVVAFEHGDLSGRGLGPVVQRIVACGRNRPLAPSPV